MRGYYLASACSISKADRDQTGCSQELGWFNLPWRSERVRGLKASDQKGTVAIMTTTCPTEDSPFFTPKQLAKRWHCSLMKLRRLRMLGKLQVCYIGRAALYPVESVLQIEEEAKAKL